MKAIKLLMIATVSVFLAACGGGGDDAPVVKPPVVNPDPPKPPPPPPNVPVGNWKGTSDYFDTERLVVLPSGVYYTSSSIDLSKIGSRFSDMTILKWSHGNHTTNNDDGRMFSKNAVEFGLVWKDPTWNNPSSGGSWFVSTPELTAVYKPQNYLNGYVQGSFAAWNFQTTYNFTSSFDSSFTSTPAISKVATRFSNSLFLVGVKQNLPSGTKLGIPIIDAATFTITPAGEIYIKGMTGNCELLGNLSPSAQGNYYNATVTFGTYCVGLIRYTFKGVLVEVEQNGQKGVIFWFGQPQDAVSGVIAAVR